MPTLSSRMDLCSAAIGESIALRAAEQTPTAVKKAELLPLIEQQKRRLEESKVTRGTFSAKITGKHLLRNAGDALQDVLGTAASAAVVGYASSKLMNEKTDNSGHIAQAAATSLTVATTSLVRSTVATVMNKSQLSERDAEIETFNNLQKKTTPAFLASYPADIQTAVKALDDEVEAEIKFADSTHGAVWFQQKIRHRELILLARPSATKPYTNFGDSEIRKKFYEDLDLLVGDYPTINASTIETLVQRIAANSQSDRPVRSQAYLYGPGGVGKTRLVNLIATTLNAPLVEINIPGKDLGSLMGQRYPARYASPTEHDEKVIGKLQFEMINAGYTNPIVFIDELKLTAANLNDLKLLLDPGKKDLQLGGYDARLDWSRATIIIGSNDPLTDEAMQTRLPQIIIMEASRFAKVNVTMKTIETTAGDYMKIMPRDQYNRLWSTCRTRMDQLIDFDNKNFPGVRFLESATENMVHYVAAGLLKGQPRTMNQIRDYVDIQYAQAKGRAMPGGPMPKHVPPAGPSAED